MRPNEHNSRWFKMPAWLLFYDSKILSVNIKVLYMYILSLSEDKGYCYASNKYFEKTLGYSQRSLNRYFTTLIDLDFIKVDINGNNKNRRIYPLKK